jgi:drug/metabolite transporter (DMT)-like permease
MKTNNLSFILQALLAAIFFGVSSPIAKLLLDDIAPIFLAAFLYLGSGTGTALVKLTQRMHSKEVEAGIKRPISSGWQARSSQAEFSRRSC